jgi:hypothetical protein
MIMNDSDDMAVMIYEEKLKVSLGMKLFWGLVALTLFLLGILCYLSGALTGYLLCWILVGFIVILALALTPKKLIVCMDKVEINL